MISQVTSFLLGITLVEMSNLHAYWGKAQYESSTSDFHSLVCHALDVCAVASSWWHQSKVIRNRFQILTKLPAPKAKAWVLFFLSLHDFGKFDLRFQLKAQEVALKLRPELASLKLSTLGRYQHGPEGYKSIYHDLGSRKGWIGDGFFMSEDTGFSAWEPWLKAVTGHHGVLPSDDLSNELPRCPAEFIEFDSSTRLQFVELMVELFLLPEELSLDSIPPPCPLEFVAGFCSICDWLGSTVMDDSGQEYFPYVGNLPSYSVSSIQKYLSERTNSAHNLTKKCGLTSEYLTSGGMDSVYPDLHPRSVQTIVKNLPIQEGLTIIEAPTGSGKTEAALAYASRLLAADLAESIIFALPTQATANAMLGRLEKVALRLFPGSDQPTNVVLAHGKARFNRGFKALKHAARLRTAQVGPESLDAGVECAQWLSQSRKRIFLGQIGVCTIDQVLISVLPVRHNFIRTFSLSKSVLIVDEVHAYDSYMCGLLERVVETQKSFGGSIILMSATLPKSQLANLCGKWNSNSINTNAEYPLVSHLGTAESPCESYTLSEPEKEKVVPKSVNMELLELPSCTPNDMLVNRLVSAAHNGASVAVICNIVSDAQAIYSKLLSLAPQIPVDIFHSRYRFIDRQRKEESVLSHYGKNADRASGRVLVGTQVIEQSLDIDFDWLVTQLCPIDLLFQRIGRLHRHDRTRPNLFKTPTCTVIVPEDQQYGLHAKIYGNQEAPNNRIFWRTEQLVRENTVMNFPHHYRPLIEKAYQDQPWESEPELIISDFEQFENAELARRYNALALGRQKPWTDTDNNITAITRDGEMSLNMIPSVGRGKNRRLIDHVSLIEDLEEFEKDELLNLNTIPVPSRWSYFLPNPQDGMIFLPMIQNDESWEAHLDNLCLRYTFEVGLEKTAE